MTTYLASLGRPGLLEVLVVVVLIALLFGAKRIPELFNSLGRSLGEFRKGQEDANRPEKDIAKEDSSETPKTSDEDQAK